MEEMAVLIPLYSNARYGDLESGSQQAFDSYQPHAAAVQPVALEATVAPGDGLVLTTGRSLYTSWDAATIHSPEADKLHREEFVEVNPLDAARLGLQEGQEVALADGRAEVSIRGAYHGRGPAGRRLRSPLLRWRRRHCPLCPRRPAAAGEGGRPGPGVGSAIRPQPEAGLRANADAPSA